MMSTGSPAMRTPDGSWVRQTLSYDRRRVLYLCIPTLITLYAISRMDRRAEGEETEPTRC